jgi:hypothetical protein
VPCPCAAVFALFCVGLKKIPLSYRGILQQPCHRDEIPAFFLNTMFNNQENPLILKIGVLTKGVPESRWEKGLGGEIETGLA